MTRPGNFSFKNSKATFVQYDGTPSCIRQSEVLVAKWCSLGQIMSCSNLSYETPLTDDKRPSSSRNVWTIGTFSLIMATKIDLNIIPIICLADIRGFLFAHTPSFFWWGFFYAGKKTFARMSWSVRRSVLRLEGVVSSNFCKASEDVSLTI